MPYFVHLKDRPLPADLHYLAFASRHAFASRADAFARVKAIGGQATHTISFVASYDELFEWRSRERARLRSGEYMPVPWKDIEPTEYLLHYAHLSIDKPGMVAYTPDSEHGVTDKQIRLTPGRYLERFYADRLTREEIADYVAQVSAVKTEFSIATSREDIRKVYRNGPSSCMGGPKSHTNQYWREEHLDGRHPAEVYGAPSDLAVAYYGTIDEPSQRTVIWPAKKRYVRIYGTGPLEHLLTRAGYVRGTIENAKILNIELSNGGHLMPYVDGISNASVRDDQFIVLDDSGPIDCQTTAGASGGDREDEDDDRDRCRHCGDYTGYDDLTDDLCPGCYDARWNCARCDDEHFDIATSIGDEWYCQSCTRERTSTCEDENCPNTWIEENEFSDAETETRVAHDLRDLCPDCASRYVWCDACEKAHDSEDGICPDCGRSPRCEETADLLVTCDDAGPFAVPVNKSENGTGSLADAVRGGVWRYASHAGQCRISYCHRPIAPGDLFLVNTSVQVSYCPDCVESETRRSGAVPSDGMRPTTDRLHYGPHYEVLTDRPSMPFPHGLTTDQIASTDNV